MTFPRAALILLLLSPCALPAHAQPSRHGGFERGAWGDEPGQASRSVRGARARDSREGKVDAAAFAAADAVDRLGHGSIDIAAGPSSWPETGGGNRLDDERPFEAAVVDRLVAAGYQTGTADKASAQVAELRALRVTLVPTAAKPKPVSGELAVGVSSRGGSMIGMAIAVDLRKPLSALVSTRLEARVRDRATGKILWEGRAEVASYEGDPQYSDPAIAERLAAALFKDFPDRGGQLVVNR